MASSRRITELASIISTETVKIDQYLESQGIASPSTELDSPASLDLPEDLAAARIAALEATDELRTLLLGPIQFLTNITASLQTSIHGIYRFKLASAFPVGQSATFAQISQTVGLNEEDTRRLLRAAMSHRVFKELQKGRVEHTAISKAIAETPLLNQYLGLVMEESGRAASGAIQAMIKWPGSEEPNETGYNIAANMSVPYWEGMKKDLERARRFEDTMKFTHASGGYDRALLLQTYDWGALGDGGLVVDVGGSHGAMCIDLARKFPGLKTINQDLPDVIAGAKVPHGVTEQVEMQVHNFLTEQTVKGADVYLFRWIFHDWADKYSVQILKNIIPAMKKGARILIGEVCLPEPGAIPKFVEQRLRGFDIAMKASLNGKERDAEDWATLFSKVDQKLKFLGVKQHPKSRWSTMEAVWEGENCF